MVGTLVMNLMACSYTRAGQNMKCPEATDGN